MYLNQSLNLEKNEIKAQNEIEYSVGCGRVYLKSESPKFEDEFQCEEDGENDVEHIEEGRVANGLLVELHR